MDTPWPSKKRVGHIYSPGDKYACVVIQVCLKQRTAMVELGKILMLALLSFSACRVFCVPGECLCKGGRG